MPDELAEQQVVVDPLHELPLLAYGVDHLRHSVTRVGSRLLVNIWRILILLRFAVPPSMLPSVGVC